MALNLDNSDIDLIKGVVNLLRDNVNGWSTSDEHGVENVWPKSPPSDVEDEFPRGIVDIIQGEDFELSTDLDIKLREVILRVTIFAESAEEAIDLPDKCESAISEHWDSNDSGGNPYTGDWTFRQVDAFAETNETGETRGKLRYGRYRDIVFETVKEN